MDWIVALSESEPYPVPENSQYVVLDWTESALDPATIHSEIDYTTPEPLIYESASRQRTGELGMQMLRSIIESHGMKPYEGNERILLANAGKKKSSTVVSTEEAIAIWVREGWDIRSVSASTGKARGFYNIGEQRRMCQMLGLPIPASKERVAKSVYTSAIHAFYIPNEDRILRFAQEQSELTYGEGDTVGETSD